MKNDSPHNLFAELAKFSTCSIANAVDSLKVRMLNEGFSGPGIVCRTESLAPMVGVAVTMKVRSANPPMKAGFYLDSPDWWEGLGMAAGPRVLVIEDVDERPGGGALVGPVHACIMAALGFTGVVTTGAVRGTGTFAKIGLHAFSGNVLASHSYCHVVEAGGPVQVAGMTVRSGDVIHGDRDGLVSIPADIISQVPAAAAHYFERERVVCEYCNLPDFNAAKLREVIRAEDRRA